MYLYSILTKNCNYSCRHCHVSAGPGNEDSTMSVSNFRKVVNNLGGLVNGIKLSGGELFTVEDYLLGYLETIREKYDKEKMEIGLQTNGFWANTERMKEILEKLRKYNINRVDIASKDKFHEEQGQPDIFKELRAGFMMNGIFAMIEGAFDEIMPIGRAAEKSNYEFSYDCGQSCRAGDGLTMNWNGELSLCCFGFFRLKGNLIEEPLLTIMERNKKRKIIKKARKGIAEVARYKGMHREEINRLMGKYKSGGFCAYLFRNGYIEGRRILD